jgi:hypothetical protein
MREGKKAPSEAGMQDHTRRKSDRKHGSQSYSHRVVRHRRSLDQPFLIDTGIIEVVLVITAGALAVAVSMGPTELLSNTQAILVFGPSFLIPTVPVIRLIAWVFLGSGTIAALFYSIYLWEWIDRNIRIPAANRSRVGLSVLALIVHLTFLFLLSSILILQLFTSNFIRAESS